MARRWFLQAPRFSSGLDEFCLSDSLSPSPRVTQRGGILAAEEGVRMQFPRTLLEFQAQFPDEMHEAGNLVAEVGKCVETSGTGR